jgi:hypothetical protein
MVETPHQLQIKTKNLPKTIKKIIGNQYNYVHIESKNTHSFYGKALTLKIRKMENHFHENSI